MANNNEMYVTLISATNQMLGTSAIENLGLQGIVDIGKTWDFSQKDQWAKALTGKYVETIFTDSEYRDKQNDVFFENSAEFGAITEIIGIEMPEVVDNPAWINVTSGTTQIGSNTVYLPVVNAQLYGSTNSWSIPIAFTGTQLNEAFNSVEGLMKFDAYVRLMAQNSANYHLAIMNGINRNNYISEKLNAGNSAGKINVVNLVAEYAKYKGVSSMTAKAFLADVNGLRYSTRVFKKYKSLMQEMSTLFTTLSNSKGKFVPYDRLVFQILADFEGLITTELYSGTYHDEFVEMPLYRNVTAWQGLTGANVSADFETLSSIDVTNANGDTVKKSGIVGFMVDKWAIMHTIVRHRVGYQRDDIKDITLNDYQFTDRYINNLTLNGVVFTVEDYTE